MSVIAYGLENTVILYRFWEKDRNKGRERKSRKWEGFRERMSVAESILTRKIFEVHSGAEYRKKPGEL